MEHPHAKEVAAELMSSLQQLMERLPNGLEDVGSKLGWQVERVESWLARPPDKISLLEVIVVWKLTLDTVDSPALQSSASEVELGREPAEGGNWVSEVDEKGPLRDFLFQILTSLAEKNIISRKRAITSAKTLARAVEESDLYP